MNIYLYVLDTMADWEYGYLLAELHSKRYFLPTRKDLAVVTVGADTRAKTTMGGLTIVPDIAVDNMQFQPDDCLILPGANTWMDAENADILKGAKELIACNRNVAAICGATLGLASIGALDLKPHTSNDKGYLKMVCPEYRGEAMYQEALVVNSEGLVTASGIAPLEFSYEVLKNLGVFSTETLENWYGLYAHKEAKYWYGLMESLSNG